MQDKTSDYILGTIRNQFGAAEGSLLAPPQQGQTRVPIVNNLRLLQTQAGVGATLYTIAFNEPQNGVANIDHYNVYIGNEPQTSVPNFLDHNSLKTAQFQAPITALASPVTISAQTVSNQVYTIIVQTVLTNGLMSTLKNSPSITSTSATTTTQLPAAIANITSNFALANNTQVLLKYQTATYNPSSMYDPATGKFTAPNTGVYLANCQMFGATGAGTLTLIIQKNSITPSVGSEIGQVQTSFGQAIQASGMTFLNQGDYITFWAIQTSGGAVNLTPPAVLNFGQVSQIQ